MKVHVGGSFQPVVVDTNRYQTGDLISLWRKSSKIQTTGQVLNTARRLLSSMNIPNDKSEPQ